MEKDIIVYSNNRYTLGLENGAPYLTVNGKRFRLSSHPYEPCLYIKDESGRLSVVHNAFEPDYVLEVFNMGRTITSITGRVYSAQDFCRMVEYAAGAADINIDDAEKVLGRQISAPQKEKNAGRTAEHTETPAESGIIITDERFNAVQSNYPDSVVDFCIVKVEYKEDGCSSHRRALALACSDLFTDGSEVIWRYNVAKANAVRADAAELFAPVCKEGKINYRRAFLCPPYACSYTDDDFDRLNAALFPNGTDNLEVYRWTCDWSEYFDEGHEWWGTLCYTVYDRNSARFVIILASSTD